MSDEIVDSCEPSHELSLPQETALCALLSKPNYEAAAEAAGIAPKTLWRYLKQPEFQSAYRQARREAVTQSVAQLQRLTSDAVLTLGEIVRDQAASPSARVTAAKVIMDMSLKAVEMEDICERIEALEEVNRELEITD